MNALKKLLHLFARIVLPVVLIIMAYLSSHLEVQADNAIAFYRQNYDNIASEKCYEAMPAEIQMDFSQLERELSQHAIQSNDLSHLTLWVAIVVTCIVIAEAVFATLKGNEEMAG
jgi:hypothetical protein